MKPLKSHSRWSQKLWSIPMAAAILALTPACYSTDPDCPEGATIRLNNPTGQCYDVSVHSEDSGESFEERICGSREEVVNPGTYQYSVSKDGQLLASGSTELSCGEDKSIYSATGSNPNPGGNTSGRPAGTIQLQCGCWGAAYPGQQFNTNFCASGVAEVQPCYGIGYCADGGLPWGRRCL